MQLCTETESKHSQKADKAIQQCDFTSPESKKNWDLYSAWGFFFWLCSLSETFGPEGLRQVLCILFLIVLYLTWDFLGFHYLPCP